MLFISQTGLIEVKVADFSLGRDFKKSTKKLTRTIDVGLGHDAFVAPEQYASLANATQLSDLYSIGALMLFMCTGENPLRTRNEGPLSSIIQALMQYDPLKRPKSVAEIYTLFDRFNRIRSPERVRPTIKEIGSIFSSEKRLTEENVMDLTEYLTKKNRLYTGSNQGDITWREYFSPLMELPPNLVPTWAADYATTAQVDLFMERLQEQVEKIAGQTRWNFKAMAIICNFLMQLFSMDRLKARVTDMVTYAYSRYFGEAYDSLVRIVTGEYNERIVIEIAMALGKYSDDEKVKDFINDNASRIKHIAFIETFDL